MDGEFPEQFKCPICFEIPEKAIYQCENGHTICNNCVEGLSLCPQCRVNLNTKNIRNRALEDLLDMMKFNCYFNSEGCTAMVTRKDMSIHLEDCTFGGEQVPLCKYLGYRCEYLMKSRKLHESFQHLIQEHSVLTKTGSIVEISIKKPKDDRSKNTLPILLNEHSTPYPLVFNSNSGSISYASIQLANDFGFKSVMFQIKKIGKVHTFTWFAEPIPRAECELALKLPSVVFLLETLLSDYVSADELKCRILMTIDYSTHKAPTTVVVELTSYMILPPSSQIDWIDLYT